MEIETHSSFKKRNWIIPKTDEVTLMAFYEETNPRDIPLEVVETALRNFFPNIRTDEIVSGTLIRSIPQVKL